MAEVSRSSVPLGRLIVLALVVLAGLVLFLWLSRETPVMVEPASVEARP